MQAPTDLLPERSGHLHILPNVFGTFSEFETMQSYPRILVRHALDIEQGVEAMRTCLGPEKIEIDLGVSLAAYSVPLGLGRMRHGRGKSEIEKQKVLALHLDLDVITTENQQVYVI
jgi:hypothetical protein